ncbi:MAG TPA: universal stress protein [Gemmatimonas aurantiaca]|uniref:Universal stress protein n=2 Tax=Gemmatimonas aurantiaca TaxID=173480 RepID=A0A3D4VC41_9BACT|nr:universal stress protein [Gemmatimonas aurantiaca]BAH39801.1 putative universal stress protein [Gemmatimonas aurantiaca T-27]HCT58188.1 universal stress protein [Gemmatimonas aurantiaca]
MYRTILVPHDGSAPSARTLPLAAAIARHTGAAVHVAIVHDPSTYIPFVPGEVAIPVFDQELVATHRQHDQKLLDGAVEQLRALGVTASGALLEGTVVEALVEYAQQAAVDMTIMGTHGRSGFERMRLGSIATAFLTRATMPVLLVPAADEYVGDHLPGGTLLCPLDGSPFAESMLPHATAFAEALGLRMHLIGVAVPHAIPMAPFGAEALLADHDALDAEASGREDYLERVASECPAGTTWSAVHDMSVARAVQDAAGDQGAGAIAMATHGRGGFKRLVLGSVTDEVLRGAKVPVLVYRKQD